MSAQNPDISRDALPCVSIAVRLYCRASLLPCVSIAMRFILISLSPILFALRILVR
ncbi:MAG: hypothetical protein VSS75_021050 [Candidatus Parabeggiatoa sp.]|nr:hypothetical protein [Candidatus Parabeggiatoa sp.]